MSRHDIRMARDPDLRASLEAIKRAAQEARRLAIQTGTDLILVENQRIVRVSARALEQGNVE